MAFTEEDKQAMDSAATDAEQALDELLTQDEPATAQDLVDWWYSWYMKAGHKRLGRLLVQVAKEKEG